MRFEGGFQGRCNKLVDGCYSFWQAGLLPLLHRALFKEGTFHFDLKRLFTPQRLVLPNRMNQYYYFILNSRMCIIWALFNGNKFTLRPQWVHLSSKRKKLTVANHLWHGSASMGRRPVCYSHTRLMTMIKVVRKHFRLTIFSLTSFSLTGGFDYFMTPLFLIYYHWISKFSLFLPVKTDKSRVVSFYQFRLSFVCYVV